MKTKVKVECCDACNRPLNITNTTERCDICEEDGCEECVTTITVDHEDYWLCETCFALADSFINRIEREANRHEERIEEIKGMWRERSMKRKPTEAE